VAGFFLSFRIGRVLGLFFFVAGLLQYRSYHRDVFGLWSYSFIISVAIATMVLLVVFLLLPRAQLVDLAFLCWGLAYFINALDSRENATNIKDLILFGSAMPAAALLQWVSLVILFVAVARVSIPGLDEKWSGLAMLLGTLIGIALLGEGFLRVKVAVAPAMQGLPSYSAFAWKRRFVRLNSEGFRDGEHSLARDSSARRMLIVGDSFAFGWGIPRIEDRIGEQVASRLAKATGVRWEVVNASKPGADTLDEITYLNQTIKYRPDAVVLIYIFNDIDYLLPQIKATSLRNPIVRSIWLNSYLFQDLFTRIRVIYYRFRGVGPSVPSAASSEMTDSEFAAYADPVLMSRHLADIASFVEIGRQKGAEVFVVPYDLAVTLQPRAQVRYADFLRQTSQHGIPICSLEHTWEGHSFRELTLSSTDGHPNERSIGMSADAIAKCMVAGSQTWAAPVQLHP